MLICFSGFSWIIQAVFCSLSIRIKTTSSGNHVATQHPHHILCGEKKHIKILYALLFRVSLKMPNNIHTWQVTFLVARLSSFFALFPRYFCVGGIVVINRRRPKGSKHLYLCICGVVVLLIYLSLDLLLYCDE